MSDESEVLNSARAEALKLLSADAPLDALRGTAARLGSALVSAANDDAIWSAIGGRRVADLNEQDRVRVRAVLDLDWVALLNALGYQPPPEVEIYGDSFRKAVLGALSSPSERDVQGVRADVRALGASLVALSGHPDATPRNLKRVVRKGVQVAGGVALIAGAAAGTVAAVGALAPAAALAAAALHFGAPHFVGEVVVEAVSGAAFDKLKKKLKHIRRGTKDQVAVDHALDVDAARQLARISDVTIGELVISWLAVAGDSGGEKTAPALRLSQRFGQAAMRDLYLAWDSAAGASWMTGELSGGFEVLARCLGDLRDALDARMREPFALARLLQDLSDELVVIQDRVHQEAGVAVDEATALRTQAATAASRVGNMVERLTAAETARSHLAALVKQSQLKQRAASKIRPVGAAPYRGTVPSDEQVAHLRERLERSNAATQALRESLECAQRRAAALKLSVEYLPDSAS